MDFWSRRATRPSLADALDKVMGDKDLAHRLGEHGRERARKFFSIETSANALRELFKRLSLNTDSAHSE